jgi:hypothetical protein
MVQPLAGSSIRVVTLRGCSADELAEDVHRRLASGSCRGPAIFDLSDVTILGPEIGEVVRRLATSLRAQPYCVVAHRRVARAACRRFGVSAAAAVFGTVGDALQAHRHAADGYGSGWAPAGCSPPIDRLGQRERHRP